MNEFNRACGVKSRRDVRAKTPRRLQAKDWPDALPTGKHTVAHRLMDRSWRRVLGRQQARQASVNRLPVLFKERWLLHRGRELECARQRVALTTRSRVPVQKARR